MKRINIFYDINKSSEHIDTKNKKEKVEKKDFLDSEKVYESFSNQEVSKEVFTALYNKYLNQLSDKNKNILSSLFDKNFFDKKDGLKEVLSTMLFLKKNWEKVWKKLNILSKVKPVLAHKMVKWFEDEVENMIKLEQKNKSLNENLDKEQKELQKLEKTLSEKFNKLLEEKNPQLNAQIKELDKKHIDVDKFYKVVKKAHQAIVLPSSYIDSDTYKIFISSWWVKMIISDLKKKLKEPYYKRYQKKINEIIKLLEDIDKKAKPKDYWLA